MIKGICCISFSIFLILLICYITAFARGSGCGECSRTRLKLLQKECEISKYNSLLPLLLLSLFRSNLVYTKEIIINFVLNFSFFRMFNFTRSCLSCIKSHSSIINHKSFNVYLSAEVRLHLKIKYKRGSE